MINPDLPVMPIVVPASEKPEFYSSGLTKREHLEMEVFKEMIGSPTFAAAQYDELAHNAIEAAQAYFKAKEGE